MVRNLLLMIVLLFCVSSVSFAQMNQVGDSYLFQYNRINSASTTTVKTGSGFLHTMTVTGGTAGTVVVYDNTTGLGPQIANFDSTNALATYYFDVVFSSGCTVVTGSATKITISYL